MNLNYDAFIKQEFLSAEEELANIIPSTDLNIPIKNEPLSDESFPPVTIKNEPIFESTFIDETVAIKTENLFQNQQQVPETADRFVIYELETPSVTQKLTPLPEQTTFKQILSSALQIQNLKINKNPPAVANLSQSHVPTTASHPILLNSQLRKRHRVVLPVNPIDKRTRYNIEGTTTALLDKTSGTADSIKATETLNRCRLLNTGGKKIINHLIKSKRNQRKQEDYALKESSIIPRNSHNENTENTFPPSCSNQIISSLNQKATNVQTDLNLIKSSSIPISPTTTPSIDQNTLSSPTQGATETTIIPELRVKCLCSLTDDTTKNSELQPFFNEMFEETRHLNKTQQRNVKISLLKAISDAEELMEQGKCCDFL